MKEGKSWREERLEELEEQRRLMSRTQKVTLQRRTDKRREYRQDRDV